MDTLLKYAPLATLGLVLLMGARLWPDRSDRKEEKGEREGAVDTDRSHFKDFMETTQESQAERARWEGAVDADRNHFKDFMKAVRRQLNEILATVSPEPLVSRSSPLRLTQGGEKLVEQLGGAAWARETAEGLAVETEGLEPFDIEDLAFAHANDLKLPALMRKVAYDEGVPSAVVRQVLGIVLRDELIQRQDATSTDARSEKR